MILTAISTIPPRHLIVLLAVALLAVIAMVSLGTISTDKEHLENFEEMDQFNGFETIFVSVASYRDDDCSTTLKNMFDNARFPERIFAGVCQQNKEGEAKENCVDPALVWRKNIRLISMPHTDAKGPTFARYQCASLYAGETYFCQIDSHTTFTKDWDIKVIGDLAKCPSAKPIISYYPHDSKSASTSITSVPVLCKSSFQKNSSVLTFEAVTLDAPEDGKPKPIPFVAGGFFFGQGSIPVEVPYDPTLSHLFAGEEITYSARLWTAGYDFFAPLQNYVFHYYTRKEKPKYWNDINNYHTGLKASEHKIVRLLGLDGSPPTQGYEYGMGKQRSLEHYLQFAGIDPKNKSTSSETKFCS